MKKFFIVIIFVSGCSYSGNKVDKDIIDINYSDDLSFEEFQIKLEEYAQNSPYPNIDE